jgi:multidrug transporter EmrE-like cation transporter
MQVRQCLVSIVTALLVTVCAGHAADAKPLRVAYVVWVGFGPFFLAQGTKESRST